MIRYPSLFRILWNWWMLMDGTTYTLYMKRIIMKLYLCESLGLCWMILLCCVCIGWCLNFFMDDVLRIIYDVVFVLENYAVFLYYFEKKNFIRYFLKMGKKDNEKLNPSRYFVLFWKRKFWNFFFIRYFFEIFCLLGTFSHFFPLIILKLSIRKIG